MGRRARQRGREERLQAPSSSYTDADGNVLVLRGVLTPKTRTQFEQVRKGLADAPAASREDAYQRAAEFLFERLAVSWTIAGEPITAQKDLLARLRFASQEERSFVRSSIRAHCAEHFPELEAP